MKRFVWGVVVVLACLSWSSSVAVRAQTLGVPMPFVVPQFLTSSGAPCSGCLLTTYVANTTTPLATYTSATMAVQNSNPVVLDSAGRAQVWLSPAQYKFVLTTAASAPIWTIDNVGAGASWNLNTIVGKIIFTSASTLTISSSSITPSQNVHAVDTAGGPANLDTIVVPASMVSSGTVIYLTANNPGANPVTLRTGIGNLSMSGGNYILNVANRWISLVLRGSTWYELARSSASQNLDNGVNGFLVGLSTGVCGTTADVTAATTIFVTPCFGNGISLYDPVAFAWTIFSSAEMSIAVPATTGTMYDLVVFNNSGTPTLGTFAWTNDTTRALPLALQNGVWVIGSASENRYLATFRTTAVSGQTEDSKTKRYVWNLYHQRQKQLRVIEATDTWTYTGGAWHQANASAANQVDVVIGITNVTFMHLDVHGTARNTAVLVNLAVGIGEDSTTANLAGVTNSDGQSAVVSTSVAQIASLDHYPPIGRHVYAWLEWSDATGTTTWFGDGGVPFLQAGMSGYIVG